MLKGYRASLQASTVAGGRHSVVTDYMLRLLVSRPTASEIPRELVRRHAGWAVEANGW